MFGTPFLHADVAENIAFFTSRSIWNLSDFIIDSQCKLNSEVLTIMEAKAKHDFTATADDELSFRRGDVLKVIF